MVTFTLGVTYSNPVSNEISVFIEKKPNEAPYIHQAVLKLNATEAFKLIDELKKSLIEITKEK